MKRNETARKPLCACCGVVLMPDWIIDDIICPDCMDRLRKTDKLAWTTINRAESQSHEH